LREAERLEFRLEVVEKFGAAVESGTSGADGWEAESLDAGSGDELLFVSDSFLLPLAVVFHPKNTFFSWQLTLQEANNMA
jgi:hypothetical protein